MDVHELLDTQKRKPVLRLMTPDPLLRERRTTARAMDLSADWVGVRTLLLSLCGSSHLGTGLL